MDRVQGLSTTASKMMSSITLLDGLSPSVRLAAHKLFPKHQQRLFIYYEPIFFVQLMSLSSGYNFFGRCVILAFAS